MLGYCMIPLIVSIREIDTYILAVFNALCILEGFRNAAKYLDHNVPRPLHTVQIS